MNDTSDVFWKDALISRGRNVAGNKISGIGNSLNEKESCGL